MSGVVNLTRDKPPLKVGDRYVALKGSALHDMASADPPISSGDRVRHRGVIMRLDERHPCGALEFVVIAVGVAP